MHLMSPNSPTEPRARFRFHGYNRHGVRVRQSVEAPTVDEAKRMLRDQGYRIERIWVAFDWRRSPWIWGGALLVVAGLVAAFMWLPLVAAAVSILLAVAIAVVVERERRDRLDSQQKRLRVAAVQSQQAHLKLLDERRKREEVLLDLAVQRIVQQLRQRRQEEEATLIQLEATEQTLAEGNHHVDLRRELERKRAEIVRLEAELRRLESSSRT